MKRSYWIFVGAVVGFAVGMVFGADYAIAGIGIGMAGGIAITLAMG
ncbi:hypothetical protein [Mesorhizobium sp. 8]|nr:hypothetical protein [Mesorhizobium sp. 8]